VAAGSECRQTKTAAAPAAGLNMKPEISNDNDGTLSRVMHEWSVGASLPPRFNEQVWHRIASEETPAGTPLTLLGNWIAQTVMRPSFVLSYSAVLLLSGLLIGSWQAHATAARAQATLSTRYLQMVDPYQMPRH
jgi:hypothetical protein